MNLINIAVVGVCISRDPFNSRYETGYKEIYNVTSTVFQHSIISLMSKVCDIPQELLKDTCSNEAHRKNLIDELNKVGIGVILESKPDYIILDLYSEIRYGVLKYKDSYITNVHSKIRKTEFYKKRKFEKEIRFSENKSEYLEILDKYFEKFINVIKENLPNTKIILLKAKYAHSYIDECNVIRNFDFEKYNYIDKENYEWEELNNYIVEKFKIDTLDMTQKEYYADPSYPFGFAPWHFEKRHYQDFIKELNLICLKDLLKVKGK